MKLPRLKFCGFTRQEDVAQALELQIDAIGLNFYPKSKRYIEPQAARKLSLIAQGACLRVGIFVDATPEQIDQVLSVCPLDAIQLHGSETIDWLGQYQQSSYWPSLPILKALAYRGAIDDRVWEAWVAEYCTPGSPLIGMLVDAYDPQEKGGTGRRANWGLLSPRPKCMLGPETQSVALLLAGGLDSQNVQEALELVKPDGIDLASGIESSPGIKDASKMRSIVHAVRNHYALR